MIRIGRGCMSRDQDLVSYHQEHDDVSLFRCRHRNRDMVRNDKNTLVVIVPNSKPRLIYGVLPVLNIFMMFARTAVGRSAALHHDARLEVENYRWI